MDHKVLLANIDRLIREQRTTDHAVSKRAGREDAIRNLRRYQAKELKGTWTIDVLEDVAKALGTTGWELLRPPGAAPQDESFREAIRAVVDEELTARESPAKPQKQKKR